ncbi:MAG: hypothetical protein AB1720_05430 [Pseudomonadota bacterium]|jgi:hypothetical protein
MSTAFNEVVIHLDETVDDEMLGDLEQDIRQAPGVVSVGHRPRQQHLLMVVYDTAAARGAGLLRPFSERGLHAQLVGL